MKEKQDTLNAKSDNTLEKITAFSTQRPVYEVLIIY